MPYLVHYAKQQTSPTRRLHNGLTAIKTGATWTVYRGRHVIASFYSLWSANEWSVSQ